MSLDDARSKCEAWRRDYNEHRPHSAIGDKCPIDLMNGAGPYGPPGARPAPDRREIPARPGPRLGARSFLGRTLVIPGGVSGGHVKRKNWYFQLSGNL
jgi:hypothetical protein